MAYSAPGAAGALLGGPMLRPGPGSPMGGPLGGGASPAAQALDPATLLQALGAVQPPPPQGNTPMAPATFPDMPRQMNPAFAQMIMAALSSPQMPPQASLGALLAGRV